MGRSHVLILFNISVVGWPLCSFYLIFQSWAGPLFKKLKKKKKKIEKSWNVRNGPRKEREKRPTNEGPAYGVWLHITLGGGGVCQTLQKHNVINRWFLILLRITLTIKALTMQFILKGNKPDIFRVLYFEILLLNWQDESLLITWQQIPSLSPLLNW